MTTKVRKNKQRKQTSTKLHIVYADGQEYTINNPKDLYVHETKITGNYSKLVRVNTSMHENSRVGFELKLVDVKMVTIKAPHGSVTTQFLVRDGKISNVIHDYSTSYHGKELLYKTPIVLDSGEMKLTLDKSIIKDLDRIIEKPHIHPIFDTRNHGILSSPTIT